MCSKLSKWCLQNVYHCTPEIHRRYMQSKLGVTNETSFKLKNPQSLYYVITRETKSNASFLLHCGIETKSELMLNRHYMFFNSDRWRIGNSSFMTETINRPPPFLASGRHGRPTGSWDGARKSRACPESWERLPPPSASAPSSAAPWEVPLGRAPPRRATGQQPPAIPSATKT